MALRAIRAGTSPPRAQRISRHCPYSHTQMYTALERPHGCAVVVELQNGFAEAVSLLALLRMAQRELDGGDAARAISRRDEVECHLRPQAARSARLCLHLIAERFAGFEQLPALCFRQSKRD